MARFRRPRLRGGAGEDEPRPGEGQDDPRPDEGDDEPKPKAKAASRRRSKKAPTEPKAASAKKTPKAAGKATKSPRKAAAGSRAKTKKDAGAKRRKAEPKTPSRLRRALARVPVARRLAERDPGPPGRARRAGGELWFRFKTRLRVIANWLREKLGPAGRLLRRIGAGLVGLWTNRSRGTKIRIVAVAAVLAAWALIRFTAIPGVPCQYSDAKECPPGDDAVALVPADALLYAHLTLDEDSKQFERASDLAERLPNLTALVDELAGTIPTSSGSPLGGVSDLLSWADEDLALAVLPTGEGERGTVVIAGVGDRSGAEAFLERVSPADEDEFAAEFAGEELAFGDPDAVRAALGAGAGDAESLEGGQSGVRDQLPELRFAEVYLSRAGIRRLLVPNAGPTTQLETFVNYGATAGMAVALTLRDGGVEVELRSAQDPELLKESPTFFTELPEFEPSLMDAAGARALVFLTVGELGPSLSALLKNPGEEGRPLAQALRRLDRDLRADSQVSLLGDLVPSLGGQAALIVEPTDAVPIATLVVEGVDSERASKALIALQKPLLRSLGTGGGSGFVPRFEERDIEGVSASSVRISPEVELTYALFEDRLVISTKPAGVASVRTDEARLADAEPYTGATGDLPDSPSALLFLNLDELLGLAEAAGLAEDPLYASLRDDIATVGSIGLAVTADETEISTDLFLAIDEED